jgi:hypothetical protein
MRLTRFWSALLTGTSFGNSRFMRLLFLRRKWVARLFLLLSLPLPVTLNLLAVVLCVFILGILPTYLLYILYAVSNLYGAPSATTGASAFCGFCFGDSFYV